MLLYEDHRPGTPVYALAFSPDGSTLASGAKDGTFVLRHSNGRVSMPLEYEPNRPPIQAVAYLPDGQSLVIGGAFGWLQYRHDGTWVSSPVSDKVVPVTSLAVLDEHTVAVGTGDQMKAP